MRFQLVGLHSIAVKMFKLIHQILFCIFCLIIYTTGKRKEVMEAMWEGVVLAESDNCIIVEGNHYFPMDSIRKEYFSNSDTTTICGWKGKANYYDITVNGKTNDDAAWYYAEPKSAAGQIKGMIAFWKGVQVKKTLGGDEL